MLDLPDVYFHDVKYAWKVYTLMEAFRDYPHLPFAGGVLDQPEALMEDLLAIKSLVYRVRKSKGD